MRAATKIVPQRLPEWRFTNTPVAPAQFGKDHWSLLAYLESRCVDNAGTVKLEHLRCNPKRHPGLAETRLGTKRSWKPDYGTRLKVGTVANHDDHDCADDLEKAGLVKHVGTGIHPVFRMTEEGWRVANLLRQHKAGGGKFAAFEYPPMAD